ncbi:helix-turn-helix domain-containing protein [Enterococcus cecorum]|uniref:helix-turn-helix domain-containing protein n=1 Tax=Enterococcus cecorum TaxID=44008 RepID=UPI001FABF5AE|nr:helix-turn-helix transcriptional regulator [Enterococcus cecorum]MCJ0597914.1 helix-turn-helix domain-containing protein [Enterococcus cecorum]
MSLVQRIKELANEKNITFAELERKIEISNGQIRRWDTASPKSDNLQKVADYFGVSVDYLLGRTNNRFYGLNEEKRELSIEQALNSVMSYDGKPMTENDREILKSIIEAYMDKKQV